MSLVDRINRNTQSVLYGKRDLEQAITAKGGTVGAYADIPSFMNLVDGVNSIESGLNVDGAEDTIVYANENITKGNVCSLVIAAGDFQANKTAKIPTTFIDGSTSRNLTLTADRIVCLDNGNLLLIPYSNYLIPFYLVDGEYKQLKVQGSYDYIQGGNPMHSSLYTTEAGFPYAYDSTTKTLFIPGYTPANYTYSYRCACIIDTDNLDIGKLQTTTVYSRFGTTVYANNGSVIVNKHDVSNNLAWITVLSTYNASSKSYSDVAFTKDLSGTTFNHVCDIKEDYGTGAIIGVCQCNYQGSTQIYLAKAVSLSGAPYTMSGYSNLIANVKTSDNNGYTGYGGNTYAQISASGSRLFYIDNTNKLHQVIVDTNTLALEEAPLIFDDGLDITKIDSFVLVKGDGFLYVKSTDTDKYADDELVRLYYYDTNTSSFQFVCCPAQSFNTPSLAGALPVQPYFSTGERTIIKNASTNLLTMYEVGLAKLDYDYAAAPCNNLLNGADGYAIASEDIAAGEMGTMKKILS